MSTNCSVNTIWSLLIFPRPFFSRIPASCSIYAPAECSSLPVSHHQSKRAAHLNEGTLLLTPRTSSNLATLRELARSTYAAKRIHFYSFSSHNSIFVFNPLCFFQPAYCYSSPRQQFFLTYVQISLHLPALRSPVTLLAWFLFQCAGCFGVTKVAIILEAAHEAQAVLFKVDSLSIQNIWRNETFLIEDNLPNPRWL